MFERKNPQVYYFSSYTEAYFEGYVSTNVGCHMLQNGGCRKMCAADA